MMGKTATWWASADQEGNVEEMEEAHQLTGQRLTKASVKASLTLEVQTGLAFKVSSQPAEEAGTKSPRRSSVRSNEGNQTR